MIIILFDRTRVASIMIVNTMLKKNKENKGRLGRRKGAINEMQCSREGSLRVQT